VYAKSELIDVDLEQDQIMLRELKGMHAHTIMLLVTLEPLMQANLQIVKRHHR